MRPPPCPAQFFGIPFPGRRLRRPTTRHWTQEWNGRPWVGTMKSTAGHCWSKQCHWIRPGLCRNTRLPLHWRLPTGTPVFQSPARHRFRRMSSTLDDRALAAYPKHRAIPPEFDMPWRHQTMGGGGCSFRRESSVLWRPDDLFDIGIVCACNKQKPEHNYAPKPGVCAFGGRVVFGGLKIAAQIGRYLGQSKKSCTGRLLFGSTAVLGD
mmetsp:Transcript_8996/g.19384  ORF Transcript_8996/g.19384 Transcript_8996/m.19384 type:complete len:209 (+) Transcript_8996:313-939(+)